jgi:hypothetical protein
VDADKVLQTHTESRTTYIHSQSHETGDALVLTDLLQTFRSSTTSLLHLQLTSWGRRHRCPTLSA